MCNGICVGEKQNFIERLTEKQLTRFLGELFPLTENYVYSYVQSPKRILVRVNKNKGDRIFNFQLEEFGSIGFPRCEQWLRYLYKIFGEEYKQAYLAECAKIFE